MQKLQNFYVRSSLFVVLSVVGAAINYVLYPVISRILSLQDFGDFVAVIGLSNQVMGVLLAFSVISIALVKRFGEAEANKKAQIIQKVLLWIFLTLSILVLLVSPLLRDILNIRSLSSFFVLSLVMILSVPTNIWSGFLQGHKEQIRVGIFTVSTSVLKFALTVLLASYYGVTGGLWGFLIGSTLGLFVLNLLPGRSVPKMTTIFRKFTTSDWAFLKEYKGYIIRSVFVVSGLVFLQNYDLNRAKALFDPDTAGIYGGVSVLSNALFYLTFLLVWVLLPEFSTEDPQTNKRVLRTAYRLIGALTVAIVVGGLLLGNRLLPLLLGPAFAGQGTTLIVASLYQISLVSVVLYAFYLLVMRRRRAVLLAGLVLLSCLILPVFFIASPLSMITSLWAGLLLGVIIFGIIMGVKSKFV